MSPFVGPSFTASSFFCADASAFCAEVTAAAAEPAPFCALRKVLFAAMTPDASVACHRRGSGHQSGIGGGIGETSVVQNSGVGSVAQ